MTDAEPILQSTGIEAAPATVVPVPAPRIERPVKPSMLDVLKNGPFLRLWSAQAISQTASNMVNFALMLRVQNIIEIHGVEQANIAISLVIISFSLPSVLFGPIAGVMADRMNRRTLMTMTNVLRAIAVVCFLVIRPGWQVTSILAATYLVTFLFGIAGQFFAPAEGATIPQLVPRAQLVSANALFNLTLTSAQLLGFATLGPILVKVIGIDELFALTVVLFLVCAGLVLTLPPTPVPPRPPYETEISPASRLWADIKEGLIFILQDPYLMKAIGYLTVASTTFLMIAALGPAFITTIIGLPKEDIFYIVAPAGIGVLIGVLTVNQAVKRFPREAIIDWALALAGCMLFLLASSKGIVNFFWYSGDAPTSVYTAVAGFFAALLGICNAFILVPAQTMLQERSHEEIRARVYATFYTISNTFAFIPIFFAAAAADLFGVVQVLIVVAAIVGSIGFISIAHRKTEDRARWGRSRTRHRQGPEAVLPPD
jgi:MFS family permease